MIKYPSFQCVSKSNQSIIDPLFFFHDIHVVTLMMM
jgi:hypothetical protein